MKLLKGVILGAALLIVSAGALGLFYVLPQHEVVLITGGEVKRVDHDGVINAENPADGPTRDVYFINTEHPDTKDVMVYRNEDTGWSFPWYFKFDSADIQAKAQGYSRNAEQLALIRYYGWRIKILSVFPNVTDIEATNSREEPFPLFNTVFLSLIALVLIVVAVFIKRRLKRRHQTVVS
ncbi:DUF1523 family protein [Pseudomonas sp. CBSPBW29]|uniref:DUF1523 family protein n=1 Tax=Pseudomonas TaxID=286 RepID=UPI0021AD4A8F|nr:MULTISPECIES: DUF1523 family protein [unclassified Pseudomonas]WEL42664.1 DUF1523 family protein [Pseudomonas sp. CBSPBW29]WEL63736.1 DUF1523 family protein [Pseudomonas sp. CBSPGW29]WEL72922.1 DUF1523 family protein [Pseudomonas sp. CBSPCGW29]WEL74234.1 DUF1523 family protein [Pseudomonas sp. CBSPAW29]WEL81529.1 DUF1523 family protein [Pseudomonas sp. CBSPCAW29]WEL90022.1 DUF1523 family protein [Pseudomonas sp. CBSPCBW29]